MTQTSNRFFDEVAGAAERVAARIITVHWMAEAERHEFGDADRPVDRDPALDFRFERAGHGLTRCAAAPGRRAG